MTEKGKTEPSDSHVGWCLKNPDACPSHDSVDSQFPTLFFFNPMFFFISVFSPAALFNGGRESLCWPARSKGREGGGETQTYSWGEGLYGAWVGFVWIKACDWLREARTCGILPHIQHRLSWPSLHWLDIQLKQQLSETIWRFIFICFRKRCRKFILWFAVMHHDWLLKFCRL